MAPESKTRGANEVEKLLNSMPPRDHVRRGRFSAGGWLVIALALAIAGVAGYLMSPATDSKPDDSIRVSGVVLGPEGPVEAAIVRVQTTQWFARTGANGRFEIVLPARLGGASDLRLTAAAPGFLIAGRDWKGSDATITLHALPKADNAAYSWVDPRKSSDSDSRCYDCHQQIVDEWAESGHAHSAVNRRFLNLHEGTTWTGARGGWSLRDERGDGVGVCFACHAPTASFDAAADGDFKRLREIDKLGVHCDFCHKIQDVSMENLGWTHGRDAYSLLRPGKEDDQFFFGPLDDVDRGEDAHLPLMSESRYCAACHEGRVFGVPVYTTFSEWRKSRAAKEGKSCQSCHMRPDGRTNIAPSNGGLERDPATLSSHGMLPGGRLAMLRQAVTLDARLQAERFTVDLTTQDVGHSTPTGFIDRHLILLVSDSDQERAQPIAVSKGPTLSHLAGEPWIGLPGRVFGRVLRDANGNSPAPFWNSFHDPPDTRLRPDTTTRTEWTLQQPRKRIRVRLVYRRFWSKVRQRKQWPDDTLVIYDRTIVDEDSGVGADR